MNADLIVCADTVHTLADDRRPVEAIAVRDGIIVATGSRDESREWRGNRTETIDLGAAVITPGLIDGHSHPVSGLELTDGTDLSGARTLDEVRALLSAAAAECAPGEWVLAWGLDPNVFGANPIDNAALDKAVDGRPTLVRLFDAHSALATAAALRIAGVDGPRTFRERASVVCDERGRPTGLLLESAAVDLVAQHIPAQSAAVRGARLRALLAEMAATGLTGAHVMDSNGDSEAVLRAAEELGELPLRLRVAPWCEPGIDREGLAALIDRQGSGGHRWRIGGVKLFIDGTIDNGTAWLEKPDALGQSTDSFWPDPARYTEAVRTLAAAGVPTATHAIGDAGVRHVLDSLDGLGRPASAPHRIEHIETLPTALIGRFLRQQVVASMQPAHCRFTRADHTDNWSTRLGEERADRAWRCRDLREAGVPVVLGSDWPIAPFDARAGLATAQLRRPAEEPDIPAVQPDQALTARMALEGYTTLAAAAAGETGTLTVGAGAHLTAFVVDPLRSDPDELADAPIALTLVEGRTAHRSHS